jgi:hypothetical protein
MERTVRKGDLEIANLIKSKQDLLTENMPGGLARLDFLGEAIKAEAEAEAMKDLMKALDGPWIAKSGISGLDCQFKFNKNTVYCGAAVELGDHKWKIDEGCKQVIIYDDDESDPIFIMTLPIPEKDWSVRYTRRGGPWIFNRSK